MEFHPIFFDKDGLLRPHRTTEYGLPEYKDAFNGMTYTSYLITLLRLHGRYFSMIPDYKERMKLKYLADGEDGDWSHDDLTGMCCQGIYLSFIDWKRVFYRAEVFLYLASKGHKWARYFFPILSVKMIWSCCIKKTAKNGMPRTDGSLLAWNILENFGEHFKITKKICHWGYRRCFGENYLTKMFSIKFNVDADHPCRITAMKIEGLIE